MSTTTSIFHHPPGPSRIILTTNMLATDAPFPRESQLEKESKEGSDFLPGYPNIPLHNQDDAGLYHFLERDLCSEDLDRVSHRLWMMSKQDGRNISPLHRQRVKGRTIVITEDPKLHLVWINDRIFIKPLPKYLLTHSFWQHYLSSKTGDDDGQRSRIRRAALGYLRTYALLIRHESDLRLAQDSSLSLVPSRTSWKEFCSFARPLSGIEDRDVSLRYCYGEIRLTRLNFYAPFFLGKSNFQRMEYQYNEYFSRFYAPFLFIIAIVSVVLSALQVLVSAADDVGHGHRTMKATYYVGLLAIVWAVCLLTTLGFIMIYKIAKEWRYALRDRRRLVEERRTMV